MQTDKESRTSGPPSEDEIVQDERVIQLVISAVTRGRRQEKFVKDAFGEDGASPWNYTSFKWLVSGRKSLENLTRRLSHFLGKNPHLGLVLIKTAGPRGGWWSGRFYIRGVPPSSEVP